MARVTVRLKDLKPNPFYKYIRGGKMDADLMERLRDSIQSMGFWDNIVCRKVGNTYQIAHGHHRVEAARLVFASSDHEVSVHLEDYDDGEMIRAMWMEDTVRKGESVEAQIDIVRLAEKHLAQNPKACRFRAPGARKAGGRPHRHGSIDCVSAFLEDSGWGRTKVAELLRMGKPRVMSPKVLRNIDKLGTKSGIRIARLKDHRAQETLADMAEKHGFNQRDVQEVVADVIDFTNPGENQEEAVYDRARRRIKDRDRRTMASARKKEATRQDSELRNPLAHIEGLIDLLKKAKARYLNLSTLPKEWWLQPRVRINLTIGELGDLGEIIYKMHREIFEPMRRLALEEAQIEEGGEKGRHERKVSGVRLAPVGVNGNFVDIAAKALGVSTHMVELASEIKHHDPALFEKMKSGEITLHAALQNLKSKTEKNRTA